MDPGLLALATLPALGLQPSQGLLAHQGLLALALLAGPPLLALAPERRPPLDLLAWPQAGGAAVPVRCPLVRPPARPAQGQTPGPALANPCPPALTSPRSGGRARLSSRKGSGEPVSARSDQQPRAQVCRPVRSR